MFQIGELAKRCGVTADTLRFYEKNNLIAPASRSESGYRLYDENNPSGKPRFDIGAFAPVAKMCNDLIDTAPGELAKLLIEGVFLEKNNLTNYLNNERFLLRPLHNLFFTRDSAMGMNDHMLIGKMANPVRERESAIMEAIFKYHPEIETKTLNPAKPEKGIIANLNSTIEGGDVQIARDDIFVIGT